MDLTKTMLTIDGSQGEGGGQILRTALSLSILEQRPIRIERIRAGRAKPGLMRQHLTCVKAAAVISAADVRGAEPGSTTLEFVPHALVGGAQHFAIGTAGSAMLVLQTVLPALLHADAPSRITIEGGTHNMLAPSASFIDRCFLPILRRMGAEVELAVERVGLYPAGGGRIVATIRPSRLQPITLEARGERRGIGAEALVAAVPEHVALREITRIADRFKLRREQISHQNLGTRTGPGNVLSVWAEFEHICELVTSYGERGVSAETVADRAADALQAWLESDAVVGEHLADQLLLPMQMAGGGTFLCGQPSTHLRSNAELINRFDGARIDICAEGGKGHRVSVA
ncbi:MAG: RNA 3'-terminal phosphate cyclase [Xanthomonadales bacterium]|nr:RNA 3'-terminal phosphate cyclase [Xanthomonadales bacterium]MBK7146490.1 RNA 3'-terminal phosphate cyclase [Xanthomonadales bacterium]MCC6562609.1 RNA 3'-terminal phosphate cyclase [Xanthomonadales bacterium]